MLDEQEMIYVKKDGRIIKLTDRETKVLSELIRGKNHVVRYAKLVKVLYEKDITTRRDISNMQPVISSLKNKLGSELNIKSKQDIGYILSYKES